MSAFRDEVSTAASVGEQAAGVATSASMAREPTQVVALATREAGAWEVAAKSAFEVAEAAVREEIPNALFVAAVWRAAARAHKAAAADATGRAERALEVSLVREGERGIGTIVWAASRALKAPVWAWKSTRAVNRAVRATSEAIALSPG